MHFNCIISSSKRRHLQERHPLQQSEPQWPAVACLLPRKEQLKTSRMMEDPSNTPDIYCFRTCCYVTLSRGNTGVSYVIHHQCSWQNGLAGNQSHTWAACINLSALGWKNGIWMEKRISTGHARWDGRQRARFGTSAAYRFPSTTSMRSSAVTSLRRVTSALWILYSARMLFTVSPSSSVWAHLMDGRRGRINELNEYRLVSWTLWKHRTQQN